MHNKQYTIEPRFLLLVLIVAYSIAPIVPRAISQYLTTYAYMLVVLLAFLIIMFRRKTSSINHYVAVLAPFILYQALTFFTRTDSLALWGYSVLLFLLPVMLGYYVLYERPRYIPGLYKTVRFCLIGTLATTILGLLQYPMAARVLATIESSDDSLAVLYNWHNIGGYEFIYTLVLLYPLAILAFKQKKMSAATMTALVISIGTVIILSEYTTALLLFLLSSCLLLVKRKLTAKELSVLVVLGVLMLTVLSPIVSDILLWLADLFDSETISDRLTALAGGKTALDAFESNRTELYEYSLNTFFQNPILGTMLNKGRGSGGHSQILDTLAIYGVVGGGLMAWMYKYIYTFFLKPFAGQEGFGYVVWFFIQALLLSVVNTGIWLEALTLYGPVMLYVIYRQKDDTDENTVDRKYANRPIG